MNKAIEEDPENPLLHRKLGDLYEKTGDIQQSRRHNDLAEKYEQ